MPSCVQEHRCPRCRKLLFKGLLVEGTVEVMCRHCHTLSVVSASRFNKLLCLIDPCPGRVAPEPKA